MHIYKVGNQRIDGLIPGTSGERAFPTKQLGYQSKDNLNGTDPFIMLDHIGPSKMAEGWRLGGQEGIHPHRGFETMTFMFKGNLHHLDTVFTERPLLTNGSVQQMNAGKGIRHGGDFWADEDDSEFHEIQLWINNPADKKMSEPYVRNYSANNISSFEQDGIQLRLIAGSYQGEKGPVQTFADIRVLHGTVTQQHNKDKPSYIALEQQHASQLIFVMTGSVQVNEKVVHAGETAVLKNLPEIVLSGEENSQFLLISGKPLKEPCVFAGPFVMNSHEQIQQAFADVDSGVF
ncbi:pirin family protein [Colwellia psychrerythraea]|uniref:Pirin domain protein n=1 Tax=Colwellia psychrerythraea TaxID=28229 RepID=A0A099KL65_COLPS|nr:pirin-like C-terminal cupin domain-containing protein [Colwellia psychrerythraea]KGJ91000.1 Pirin domain protein [Colwellia psychrerythraea]